MARYLRSMLPLAAAVAAVSLLSIASPVSAAGVGETVSANAAGMLSDVRQRTPQRIRLAASRDHRRERYVQPAWNGSDCPAASCRRHFVLMIGIAY
ncbi:hypothetical protein [Bradyrhizobium roseum]|uniref:hypothetical protein n=1 Tax=Bradyrhizobium roseum TaxID=3056648 RepID=UPI0026263969|nr:hypothetical protein [Bradyrhizobium roseus]WKA26560.1 hypothetical protein QUH67_23590 [Bradyrhizobium roseus]